MSEASEKPDVKDGFERLWENAAVGSMLLAGMAALHFGRQFDGEFWYALGQKRDLDSADVIIKSVASFIRANPGANGETLFRFAAGQNVHDRPGDDWETLEWPWRAAYETFARLLPVLDRLADDLQLEFMDQQRRARALNAPPPISPGALQPPHKRFDRKANRLGGRKSLFRPKPAGVLAVAPVPQGEAAGTTTAASPEPEGPASAERSSEVRSEAPVETDRAQPPQAAKSGAKRGKPRE